MKHIGSVPRLIFALSLASLRAGAQDVSWPTNGWTPSTPAAEGLSAEPLQRLDRRIRNGDFGYIDRVVVVRHGRLVVNGRYDNDYREISRGRTGPIGCGFGCSDPNCCKIVCQLQGFFQCCVGAFGGWIQACASNAIMEGCAAGPGGLRRAARAGAGEELRADR